MTNVIEYSRARPARPEHHEESMWINLVYDTDTGMGCSVWGPYKTLEAAQAGDGVPDHARETGCWTPVKLVNPDEIFEGYNGYSADGSVVVFDGNITREQWMFYGPFVDVAVARKCAKWWGGPPNPLKLKPVPVKEPA